MHSQLISIHSSTKYESGDLSILSLASAPSEVGYHRLASDPARSPGRILSRGTPRRTILMIV